MVRLYFIMILHIYNQRRCNPAGAHLLLQIAVANATCVMLLSYGDFLAQGQVSVLVLHSSPKSILSLFSPLLIKSK